ncbi:MAG: spermidine/putrescine ABC transporter substrate-binding protein [Clostridia bacterium]|nr:spermidine/putrescine ABC transporter substrate-binding protein [Clostridia bacterium]
MKKIIIFVLVMVLTTVLVTACAQEDKVVLNVYNWGDYIDEDIFEMFEEETGIKINYETYATNEEMYTKIKKGGTKYDLAIPSEYMIEKMIREEMLEKIDLSKIPNYINIDEDFKNLSFDPDNAYSVPYFWGTVGIIYNTELIDEPIQSWDVLWDDKYAGQFTMMDSQRDSIMVALKKLGYSMNTKNLDELEEAKQLLIEQKPMVLAYVGDNVKDMLISGEAAMAVVWSGEASAVIQEYDEFEYVLPVEGSNKWFDNIVIPKGAKNIDAAHQFIDFLCRSDIGFLNADYVGYSTVNSETLKLIDPDLMGTTYAYPLDEWIENYEIFNDPGDFILEYDRIWTEVKAN